MVVTRAADRELVGACSRAESVLPQQVYVRRVTWALKHGSSPDGFLVRTCGELLCVNPNHYKLTDHPLEDYPSTIAQRFWRFVDRRGPTECWPWLGALLSDTYGSISLSKTDQEQLGERSRAQAHRIAWALTHKSPGTSHVLHTCDNPRCVNPGHLFLGDHAVNMADKAAKGRATSRKLSQQDKDYLRELREEGWSLRELAQRFDIAPSSVRWHLR
jgi:hypothetical protein